MRQLNSILRHPHFGLSFRLGVGGFFLVASIAKLSQPAGLFANQIKSFGIIPVGWEMPLALILPWLELFLGWFLVAGYLTFWASGLIVFQLVVFSIVLFASIVLGTAPEDCGCLPGVSETPVQALIRDLMMLGWFALAFRAFPGSYSIDRWMTKS